MFKQPMNGYRVGLSRDWVLLLICILSISGFLLLAYYRSSFSVIDKNVNLWAITIQSNAATVLAKGVAFTFDTATLIAASAVISIYLFLKNYRAESLLLLGAMAGDAFFVGLFKNIIKSARPINAIATEIGYSFPSGHSTIAIIFIGLIVFFALQYWKSNKAKFSLGALLAGLAFMVGFDRLYLNVHWFSDVLGG